MPYPSIPIPTNAGLLRAYVGAMRLLAATKQWQKETGRSAAAAADMIFFPGIPINDLKLLGFGADAQPIPNAILSRPFALPYHRGRGPMAEPGDHRDGALTLNLNLAENPAYSDNFTDREADILARMEVCIEQMRDLNGDPIPGNENVNYWKFTDYAIFHRTDTDTGEPGEIGLTENGQAWNLRDWNNNPLGRRAYTSTWILEFGY